MVVLRYLGSFGKEVRLVQVWVKLVGGIVFLMYVVLLVWWLIKDEEGE
jgi:hypothetical protein